MEQKLYLESLSRTASDCALGWFVALGSTRILLATSRVVHIGATDCAGMLAWRFAGHVAGLFFQKPLWVADRVLGWQDP